MQPDSKLLVSWLVNWFPRDIGVFGTHKKRVSLFSQTYLWTFTLKYIRTVGPLFLVFRSFDVNRGVFNYPVQFWYPKVKEDNEQSYYKNTLWPQGVKGKEELRDGIDSWNKNSLTVVQWHRIIPLRSKQKTYLKTSVTHFVISTKLTNGQTRSSNQKRLVRGIILPSYQTNGNFDWFVN